MTVTKRRTIRRQKTDSFPPVLNSGGALAFCGTRRPLVATLGKRCHMDKPRKGLGPLAPLVTHHVSSILNRSRTELRTELGATRKHRALQIVACPCRDDSKRSRSGVSPSSVFMYVFIARRPYLAAMRTPMRSNSRQSLGFSTSTLGPTIILAKSCLASHITVTATRPSRITVVTGRHLCVIHPHYLWTHLRRYGSLAPQTLDYGLGSSLSWTSPRTTQRYRQSFSV